MRSIAVAVLLALVGCKDGHQQQRTELASAQAAEANAAFERGELQRALYASELATQYDPLDPALRDLSLRLALAQIAANRPSLSLEQFGRAAYQAEVLSQRDPGHRQIYETVRAIDAFARGDPAAAEKRLIEVTKQSPQYAPAWLMLGDLLQANRRTKEALSAFGAAAKLEPRNARAVANIGMIQAQLGDFGAAVESLTRAISMEDSAALRATLANAYLALDHPLEALPQLARATKMEPREGRYRVSLGEAHLRLDQLEEAAAAFRDASTLGAEPFASRGLGAVAMKRKDFAAAAQAFNRVLAQMPDEVSTLFLAAEAQEGLGHSAEAIDLYARFAGVAAQLPSEGPRVLLARDRLARLGPASK